MKTFHYSLTALVATSALAISVGSAFAAGNPNVDHEVQAFLQKLEAGGGKPIEQLPPAEARKVAPGAKRHNRHLRYASNRGRLLDKCVHRSVFAPRAKIGRAQGY